MNFPTSKSTLLPGLGFAAPSTPPLKLNAIEILASFKITFDLLKERQNYAAASKLVYDKIASLGIVTWRPNTTTVYLVSRMTAAQIHDFIRSVMDRNDRLTVDPILGSGFASDASGLALIKPAPLS